MKLLLYTLALLSVALAAPSSPGERIIGGVDAERGQFVSIASLQNCFLSMCAHTCGGTVISPSWIVTAGHCYTQIGPNESYSVMVGVLNLNDTNPERQVVKVALIIVHPEYPGGVNINDIALMKLASKLIFNKYVQPSKLPKVCEEEEYDDEVILAGWGTTGGIIISNMPDTLQWANLPIVKSEECNSSLTSILDGYTNPYDPKYNICTGPLTGGYSACNGDSGGPLEKDKTLVGIVSWGITPCGTTGAPSVYTKVCAYIDFLLEHVDESLIFE